MANTNTTNKKSVAGNDLPEVFNQEINPELLKRAYLAEESENFQLKHPDYLAGKRKAAELTKRRRSFKTVYGGRTRTPKKSLSHVGSHFMYVGAVAPNTVGGRQAHPPKAEMVLVKKLNKKEHKLAVRMGIAGSAQRDLVARYHLIDGLNNFPVVVEDGLNDVAKTKDALKMLSDLGLEKELTRLLERKIRAGRGKFRGRKYQKKLALVIVTTDDSKLKKAASNLNIAVRKVDNLSVSDVSQAGRPGRLILWTKGAIAALK